MVATADKVAVEVEAKLNAAAARTTEAQFDQSMGRIAASAGKAERAVTDASAKMEKGMGAARGGAARLGVQIGQLGSSLGSGMSPMIVFAQQASDFAYVLNGTAGIAGRVAAFFSGPWGAALLSAGVVASIFLTRQKETATTLEDVLDKMKKNAAQAALNAQAERIWQATTEGLTEAIRKRREELEKALLTDIQAEQQAKAAADADIARARARSAIIQQSIRDQQQLVTRRRNELTQAEGGAGAGDSTTAVQNVLEATQALQRAQTELRRRQSELTSIQLGIWNAEAASRAAQASISERTVEAALDPVKKATDDYTRALGDLRAELRLGMVDQAEYERRLLAITKARNEAVDAAQKQKRATTDADMTAFGRPVSGGTISGRFGESRPGHQHAGVDIAVPVGTDVTAAAGGVVIESGTIPGYGNVVVIDHGRGTISRYAHLSQISAPKGTVVEAGQLLGLSGGARGAPGAGNSQGPHLHFEVRRGGRPVDPFGSHPTDVAGTSGKADQLARQAEAEAQRALAQTARYDNEMRQLQDQQLDAERGRVTTAEQQLEVKRDSVQDELDQRLASYEQAAQQHQITARQAELLQAKARTVAAAKQQALTEEDGFRRSQVEQQLYATRQEAQIAQLQFEADNTKTGQERRVALLALLDAETTLQRIRLQQTIDATVAGTAEHEIAVLKLQQLDAERGRRAASINADPRNMSPGQAYAASLQQTAGQINDSIEAIAVDGLERLNDELTAAIMGTESLGDAFRNVAKLIISELIKIAIQQAIIKPLAQLFGASSGGAPAGGAGGGDFASIIQGVASFFGGHAAGGSVTGGRPIVVGEQGTELWVPPSNGQIIPNHALASLGGNSGGVVEVHVISGEYFDARVGRVTGPVIARASVQAARGGSTLAMQGLGRRSQHRLE